MIELINEPIPGLFILKPRVFTDDRGFFLETWQEDRYKSVGIKDQFVQDNWSRSTVGVLRGLHFQKLHPQGKLVSVHRGVVFDVAVDIRKNSPTFGQWHGEILSDENHLQMYVPPGFAHGFCVISDIADFVYKCTDYYNNSDEGGIVWSDKELNIKWPIDKPIVSQKDQILGSLSEL
ncbi:MAG: dTDP-4-dehydrorhamnose 3,5-epimerase [Cyclobacteriaceae bacterium]|nr:dTDP-4-dehydrorhamnose 3,5-epimerase [Cyclobacteriaceae bacterium]